MASGGLTRVSGLLLPKAQGHPVAYLVLGLSAVTSEDAHTVCAAWIAKAIAGRPKDVEFCRALVARSIVTCRRLRERLAKVSGLDARVRASASGLIPA